MKGSLTRFALAFLKVGLILGSMQSPLLRAEQTTNEAAKKSIDLNTLQAGYATTQVLWGIRQCVCDNKCPPPGMPWITCNSVEPGIQNAVNAASALTANQDIQRKSEGNSWMPLTYDSLPKEFRDLINSDGSLSAQTKDAIRQYQDAAKSGLVKDPVSDLEKQFSDLGAEVAKLSDPTQRSLLKNNSESEGLANNQNAASSLTQGHGAGSDDSSVDPYAQGTGSTGRSGFRRVGPSESDNALASVMAPNLMELLNKETGEALTLFERATRRYQGVPPQLTQTGMRAFILARMETIRREADKQLRTPASTPAHP